MEMELVFLVMLFATMILALGSGFPVAFALPGSAILTISVAAACGFLFVGDVTAYFAQGGPVQWLSAGVTNFRGVYWEIERDTLIAIPLFVFMGIMLQRSRIAEDLLVTMAQLFGPIPGGLGMSVVFVGALLAATTGIVGATVVAMGLISLPAMLRHNYSRPLVAGTICASGTLGQIIPPSIVLIILADQLSSAADQAGNLRKAEYKEASGEFSMPVEFDVSTASAGDMFLGAFLPGLVLVGLYMVYILVFALIRPSVAPPVHNEKGFDLVFVVRVLLTLVPPLALIFAVLGSIVLGVATVNQAGAIGAVGATIMAGYRLMEGRRGAYAPAILAIVSLVAIFVLHGLYDLNVKNVANRDVGGILMAAVAVSGLVAAVLWSGWRTFRIDRTLHGVMVETAKTTSMVFIILIGAAMLTAAFRGFGGEELVRQFLTGLPGGFVTQFIVVMAVIFLLGFFLDFIEIAVVVVPIVAPILLADPSANVTAVWLGVMIGINMQTSFLTPPFGFALFYLRGVAPPTVRTTHIYKGAVAFILLQLGGLAIAGIYPSLVNYLPSRTYLTAETAPPPRNPKLQHCLESYVFGIYERREGEFLDAARGIQSMSTDYLPEDEREDLTEALAGVIDTFDLVADVKEKKRAVDEYVAGYRPLHTEVRNLERQMRDISVDIRDHQNTINRITYTTGSEEAIARYREEIEELKAARVRIEQSIPDDWKQARQRYVELAAMETRARTDYRRTVDASYEAIRQIADLIDQAEALAAMAERMEGLAATVAGADPAQAVKDIEGIEDALDTVDGVNEVESPLSKARRALSNSSPDPQAAAELVREARQAYESELSWRRRASAELGPALQRFAGDISGSIGLRVQERLNDDQADEIASCLAVHRDISLHF
jgi:tripartite ATP-independent transporter DctM subunit